MSVKRYRISYAHGIVEDTGQMQPAGASEPMVIASDYDALLAERNALEKDAMRYRWFCAQEYPDDIADDATKWPDFKAALDERADAALATIGAVKP